MTTDQNPHPDFDQQALSRFWAKVNKTDTCWSWTGSTDQYGYGQFWVNGRRYAVHRLSYLMAHGDIPKGLVVDHLCHGWDANCKAEGNWCHHRACVNPEHLEAITHRENLLRGHGVSGEAARRTYCPHGHPYDEANTYFNGGTRRCRACREARKAAERTVLPPAERTHCPQGHPYDEENTYRRPNGTRSCRACRSRRNRRSGQGEPRGLAPSQVDGELEQHRLTLSLTLGLGTGAPWDAIHEQVALLRRVAAEEQPAETPMFGTPDCTCTPFTRQGGKPRYCGPTDTVDMISGWEIGRDCPHHKPAVGEQPETQGASAADVARALDNATPYPIELAPQVCAFMADRLLEMLTIGRRDEHELWQPEEPMPAGPQPQPMPEALDRDAP